jgi:hypothetical protein
MSHLYLKTGYNNFLSDLHHFIMNDDDDDDDDNNNILFDPT